MTEYGRIHTDGSRSGGQPIVIREGRTMKGCVVSQESLPHRPAPPAPNKAVAKIEALRQPTQSDAIVERLADALLPLAELYGGDVNMNDPLKKWLTIGHFADAKAALAALAALQEQSK